MKPSNPTLIRRIVVTGGSPAGIEARVEGQLRTFPDRAALFRSAVQLIDEPHEPEPVPHPRR